MSPPSDWNVSAAETLRQIVCFVGSRDTRSIHDCLTASTGPLIQKVFTSLRNLSKELGAPPYFLEIAQGSSGTEEDTRKRVEELVTYLINSLRERASIKIGQ